MPALKALITFKTESVEDRAQSLATGHYAHKDVDFATVTAVGGSPVVELEITKERLNAWKADEDTKYRYEAYMAWKEGQEPPLKGFNIKEWPTASASQVKTLLEHGIKTVEQVAEIPDGITEKLGYGFITLKTKAKDWLANSQNAGKIVEEINALKVQMASILEENEKLKKKNELLELQTAENSSKETLRLPKKATS